MKKLIEECLTFIKKYFALAPLLGYQCVFYVVIICGIFFTEVMGVNFIKEPFITLALIALYILNTVITLVGVIIMGMFFKKNTCTKQEIMISNLVVKLFNFLLIIVDVVLIYIWKFLNN